MMNAYYNEFPAPRFVVGVGLSPAFSQNFKIHWHARMHWYSGMAYTGA